MRETFKKFNILLLPILLLCVIAFVLFLESLDITYKIRAEVLPDLPAGVINEKKNKDKLESTCLLLIDSRQENNEIFSDHVSTVLDEIRVNYDLVDIAQSPVPEFTKYRTAVIVFQNLDVIGNDIVKFTSWVEEDGGRAMFFCTPDTSPVYRYLSSMLNIVEGGNFYTEIRGMYLADDFMLGSKGFNYHWDEPMSTAQNIRLGTNAKVYAYSDSESRLPLIWSNKCGKGVLVMSNHGLSQKSNRGLTAATYSLLEDVSIHPVINTSTYFLDDFPSPVPMGDAKYIRQFYNRDISSFYSNIWWPDVLQLAEDYGIKFTGVVIEDYNDLIEPPFPRYSDQERFNYFGAMLLKEGGEIGIHGYNHLPLVLGNFDLKGEAEYYKKWNSEEHMVTALREAFNFTSNLYPDIKLTTYVPPSNILSPEGRKTLKNHFPELKTIGALYLEGEISYTQEFCIADDGIVEFPRVISGTQIDSFMYWAAINALNMYYVNSHFMHPDDCLDEDRGAAIGWDAMKSHLVEYIEWVQAAAPNMRELTARDGSKAIERYDVLSFERTDDEDIINMRIFGFWDEAYFMVRLNAAEIKTVEGGTLEHISGDHYLLKATSANVTIELER